MPVREIPLSRDKGVERLVISGRQFLELPRAALTRVRYNEYPERYPLNPLFPLPGRRAGSPVKAVQNAPASAAGAEQQELPGGAVAGPSPVVDVYPLPRERGSRDTTALPTGGAGSVLSDADRSDFLCPATGGTIEFTGTFAAGQTRTFSSRSISAPFVITHVTARVVTVPTAAFLFFVIVSDDNDTTLGIGTAGDRIFSLFGGQGTTLGSEPLHIYPNYRVSQRGKFVKIVGVNQDAAGNFMHSAVDIMVLG